MRTRERAAILALLAALSQGCASAPTSPPGWLPDADAVGRNTLGAWIEIDCGDEDNGTQIDGELLAVDDARVYVLRPDSMRVVAIDSVREARVTWYDSKSGAVAGAAVLGTLSTISNGRFFVFTAPVWMIGGTIAAHSQYHAPIIESPDHAWDDFRPFARFPQGLPQALFRARATGVTVPKPLAEPRPPR